MIKESYKKYLIPIVLAILTIITVSPLFMGKVIRGDDFFFHLLRIEDIKNGLIQGHFPVYIMPESLYGYGYANGIFYPDLLLYFPALLRILGVNLKISYAIFMSICTLAATFSMYICVIKIFKSRNIGFYASIIYIFAEYKIADLYLRSAVGEYVSFIFIPIILLGVYELIYRDYNKYYILTIGMTGIVLSHLLSVVLVTMMCIIIYIFSIKNLIKNPKRLINSIKAAILTVLLTTYTWLPIIGQFSYDKYRVGDVVKNAFKYAISIKSIYRGDRSARFFIGFIVVGILLYAIVIIKKRYNNFVNICFIISVVFTSLTLKNEFTKVIFNKFSFLSVIQFPWRLGLIATPLLAIVFAYSLNELFGGKYKLVITTVLLACLVINVSMFTKFYRIKKINLDNYTNNHSNSIGWGKEYLPEGADVGKVSKRGNVIITDDSKFEYSNYKKEGTKIELDFKSSKNNTKIDLPLIYYYGYTYKIFSDNGELIKEGKVQNSEDMYVRVDLGDINEGKMLVDYTGTIFMKIGNIITILSIICVIFLIYRKKRISNNI